MKKYLIPIFLLVASICADTINFKNGAVLEGKIIKKNDSTITISIKDKETTYSMNDIKSVKHDTVVSAPPPPPPIITTPSSGVKELKEGTILHVIMTSSLNTAKHNKGDQFKAKLENDLITSNGTVIVKKGSNLYGIVLQAKQAGRMVGQSQMMVTFNAISMDGKYVEIKTNTLDIMSKDNQAKDSVKKVARGAVIGAMINGNDGARDGAKVGIGLSMLTRGKSTGVEAGTLFNFTLTSTIIVK